MDLMKKIEGGELYCASWISLNVATNTLMKCFGSFLHA